MRCWFDKISIEDRFSQNSVVGDITNRNFAFSIQLGFGKSMPTNCVWLDGLSSNVSDQYLTRHFCRYGPVVKVGGRFWCVV